MRHTCINAGSLHVIYTLGISHRLEYIGGSIRHNTLISIDILVYMLLYLTVDDCVLSFGLRRLTTQELRVYAHSVLYLERGSIHLYVLRTQYNHESNTWLSMHT
jgi:hypothetical protein